MIRKIDKVLLINHYLTGVNLKCKLYYKQNGGLLDTIIVEIKDGELITPYSTYNYNRTKVVESLNEYYYQVKKLLGAQYNECIAKCKEEGDYIINNKIKKVGE